MEQLIALLAFGGIFLAIFLGLACFALTRKLRELTHKQQVLATEVDYRFGEVRQNIDAIAKQTAAQLQRFAQPLTPPPAPQPPPPSQPSAIEPALAVAPTQTTGTRQSVTERRHRVLTLARRGMDVKAIAQALGIPHGEVALIIRMSNPKFGD
ncbi:MAG TPA: hypothetical protein VFZ34_24470 [Blastocatellia bacterium]|nr:hypothetical protein [Blastocatellia bacterium]